MLNVVVREALYRVANRFELVALASERTRQLLDGARPTVDNPTRERLGKVALREIVEGKMLRDGNDWKVDRPGLTDLFDDSPEASADEEE